MVWGWAAFCSESPRLILIFFAAEKNGPPAVVVAATRSASDSNFRSGKGEWFRLQTATTHGCSILDFRVKLGNRCKVFPFSSLFRALILDFMARLANQCRVLPVYALIRASILDFRARLGNRCSTIVATTMNCPACSIVVKRRQGQDATKAA